MTKISQKKLAVIDLARQQLHLSDEEYRLIMQETAGVESAKELDDEQFLRIMTSLYAADTIWPMTKA
ncbi:MAG: hypothetical protein KA403_02620 [Candidatus Omnitrophica bacterium]|nr:hypothetical protein [Candidatus Omnitrophota bacterium]